MTRAPDDADREGDLPASVGRRAARRAFWLAHGERSLARNLAMIGVLGWLVVTPTLAGAFVGRWLDQRFSSGVFWSGGLIVVGLAAGCWAAWRRIGEIEREDGP